MPIPKLVITAAMMAAQMAMTMTRKIEGPRLDDTKFTGGDYGASLPFVWGTRRLQVPVFWAEELREVKRRRKTKGGKFNEYTYYGTFAVALAGREIEAVRRIWFDTHLVFDLSGEGPITPFELGYGGNGDKGGPLSALGGIGGVIIGNQGAIAAEAFTLGDTMAFYRGTETQGPDPRIQATEGEANTPAYRGTAYIVFKDLPLEKLGNRIPQVSVEMSGGQSYPSATLTGLPGSRMTFAADYATAAFTNYLNGVALVDITALARMTSFDWTANVEDLTSHFAFLADGSVLATNEVGTVQIKKSALTGTETDITIVNTPGNGSTYSAVDADGTEHTLFISKHATETILVLDGAEVSTLDLFSYNVWPQSLIRDTDGDVWIFGLKASDLTTAVFYNINTVAIITSAGITDGGGEAVGFHYADATLDHFVIAAGGDLFAVSRTDGSIVTSNLAPDYTAGLTEDAFAAIRPGAASFWVGFEEISSADLTRIRLLDYRDWVGGGSDQTATVYDPINHALIDTGATSRWCYLDRVGTAGATLQTIANEIAAACGIEDYDFSAFDQTIQGWSATRGQASNMLEPLLDVFDSDIRPHDFTIQGLKRAGTTAGATLTTEWMTGNPRYSVTVRQAAELPRALLVDFADVDADQQVNTARADRPLDTSDARSETKIDMSTLVLAATDARQLASRHFRRLWNERKELSFSLTAQSLGIEPGDVRTIELDGETLTARCVSLTARADDTIQTKWKYDAPTLATLDGSVGADFLGRVEQTLVTPVMSKGFVLDIPLVNDADDATPPQVYALAAPYADGAWPGAVIYQSIDGEYSDEVAGVNSSSQATWGTCTELAYANPNLWDRGNSITVTLQTGTLTGCTEAQADANPLLNLVAVGVDGRWELVQFTTATLVTGKTYTVSGFKRGRRGTEWAAELHAAGDEFVLLDTADATAMSLSEVGTALSFKAITSGRSTGFAFGYDYEGQSLMPYAPTSLEAVKESNDDWTITWIRRTRVGGAWRSGYTIPLSEASEAYEVDIMSGATVVRTISTTTQTATYTAAQQVTDGGDVAVGDLEYRVRQISAAVGDGFNASATA